MPQTPVNTLQRAHGLPANSACIICHEPYSAEPWRGSTAEVALLLPCNHHVGSECLSAWISEDNGNTCPVCRTRIFNHDRFFQLPPPRDISEYSDLYDPDGIMRDVARRIEQAGGPLDDRSRLSSSAAGGGQSLTERETIFRRFEPFFYRTPEWHARSFRVARAIAPTPAPPAPGYERFQQVYRSISLESEIESLARSFRLLAFRETLLYTRLKMDGAQLPQIQVPYWGLNAEAQEALFLEIERRGAFNRLYHVYQQYVEGNSRERWRLHRERHAQVWDPHDNIWE